MKKIATVLAVVALAGACRSTSTRQGRGEPQVVALVVDSEPAGAKVTVNGLDRGWKTPCDVADFSFRRGALQVEVTLEGHETARQAVMYDGRMPVHVSLRLAPEGGGTVVLLNAVPGAAAYLLRVAAETKDPAGFVRLWSENDAALREALSKLSDEDARRAPMRIRDLGRIGSPPVQALAKARKLAGLPDPKPVARRGMVDLNGIARFPGVPGGEVFHVFATRAGSPDFHRPDVKVEANQELTIDAGAAPEKPATPAGPAQNAQAPGPRIKVRSPGGLVRVSVGGKPVAELASKPDELLQLAVPAGPVHVDFVDAKTGKVTHSVDLSPDGVEPPPLAEGDRVGQVQLVHRVYGVFVRLDPGLQLVPGDEIVIAREGREVARAKVVRVAGADASYPAGAAQVARAAGAIRKGDQVLRPK